MQINNISPPPIDNDPPPPTDEGKKSLMQFISKAAWGSFKTWLYTSLTAAVNQMLAILQNFSRANGTVTINDNVTINGALNGLSPVPGMAQMRQGVLNFPGYFGLSTGNTGIPAPAGAVGQIVTSSFNFSIPASANTNCTSIALGPGIWLIWGNVLYSATNLIGNAVYGPSAVSATFGAGGTYYQLGGGVINTNGVQVISAPFTAIVATLTAASTTYFAVGFVAFASGTVNAQGFITALRIA